MSVAVITNRGSAGTGSFRCPLSSTVGPLIALMLLALLPYADSLDHPPLRDDSTVLDNAWLADEADVASVWRHHYWHGSRHRQSDLYRPLTVLSLVWNQRVWPGTSGLRAVNAALHALCAQAAP